MVHSFQIRIWHHYIFRQLPVTRRHGRRCVSANDDEDRQHLHNGDEDSEENSVTVVLLCGLETK